MRNPAIEGISTGPLPGSHKVYVAGSRHPYLRVPMREISQTATRVGQSPRAPELRPNPSLAVYDSSGPYTDPSARIDLRRGLAPARAEWISARGDVEVRNVPAEAPRIVLVVAEEIRFLRSRHDDVRLSSELLVQSRRGALHRSDDDEVWQPTLVGLPRLPADALRSAPTLPVPR